MFWDVLVKTKSILCEAQEGGVQVPHKQVVFPHLLGQRVKELNTWDAEPFSSDSAFLGLI